MDVILSFILELTYYLNNERSTFSALIGRMTKERR